MKLNFISQAFDSSNRIIDDNGRLIVNKSLITKAEVSQYYGQEMPNWESIGLEAAKKYNIYRPIEELKKCLSSFNMLPLLSKHIMDFADEPKKEVRIGCISDAYIDGEAVYSALSVWDKDEIQQIQSEQKRELSLGYVCDFVKEEGEYKGVHYDLVMRGIKPNHLALVETARVKGAQVFNEAKPAVKDKGITKISGETAKGASAMKKKLDLLKAFGIFDEEPEKLKEAQEVAEKVEKKEAAEDEGNAKLKEILVAKLGEEKAGEILKALEESVTGDEDKDDEGKPKVKDNDLNPNKEEKDPKVKDEGAAGATPKKEEGEAMDAAAVKRIADKAKAEAKAEFLEIEKAKEAVRHVIGSVAPQDSADAYYRLACKSLGIKTDGVKGGDFKTLFSGACAILGKQQASQSPVLDGSSADAATKEVESIFAKLKQRE